TWVCSMGVSHHEGWERLARRVAVPANGSREGVVELDRASKREFSPRPGSGGDITCRRSARDGSLADRPFGVKEQRDPAGDLGDAKAFLGPDIVGAAGHAPQQDRPE